MKIFLLTIAGIIFINNLIMYIYCKIAKRKSPPLSLSMQVQNNMAEIQQRNVKRKPSLFSNIKRYLSGLLRYNLILLGKIPSHHIRNFFYKNIYMINMGKNVVIYGGAEIRAPWNIIIGDGTIIGDDSKLDGRKGLIIGKNVNFSTGVWIWTDQHDVNDEYFGCLNAGGKVIIEDRVWLGSRVTVLPKKILKEGSIAASGAVVTKDLEPFTIYGGIPAKKIGERNKNLKYEFNADYIPFY